MLAIGEFSRMTHLSIRTLRRYHEVGLLEPEAVDVASGYRYYSPGLYDNALFEQGRGRLLLYRPAPEPPTRGRVHPVTLPAAELAVTTHQGEHEGIDVTYGEFGSWVAANALTVAGPVRERYLVGPRDTDDSTAWRTEIGWPVFRVAAAP